MPQANWFDRPSIQTEVKVRMVRKYFRAWARVMASNATKIPSWPQAFAYHDLFAGRGEFRDGSASTPLLVLEEAIRLPDVRKRIYIRFNDADTQFVEDLRYAVGTVEDLDTLVTPPRITNVEVGPQIAEEIRNHQLPTLFFLDPWGYKGLSLELVAAAIQRQGSECILFFNFNAINRDIATGSVRIHMENLFGRERLARMLPELESMDPPQREDEIMQRMHQGLSEAGAEFVLDFQFMSEQGDRTSHYLIHVCNHPLGHKIMKDVMAGESSPSADGIATYVFSPILHSQGRLPIMDGHGELADRLMARFSGQTLTRAQIQEQDAPGTPYRHPDYRLALLRLEEQGRIECDPPLGSDERRAGSFPEHIVVTFPAAKRDAHGPVKD